MTYSSVGKYRGTKGILTVGGGSLVFTRKDGLISKKERVVVTIPTDAVVNVNIEGMIRKKLVILVDGTKVPGIPRHEFELADPYRWKNAIQTEMGSKIIKQSQPPQSQPTKEIHVKEIIREIVKIPCKYCGTLNEITEKKCSNCGASIGGK
jgi:hypothetical protein